MDGDAVSALYYIDLSNNYLVWQGVPVFKLQKRLRLLDNLLDYSRIKPCRLINHTLQSGEEKRISLGERQ